MAVNTGRSAPAPEADRAERKLRRRTAGIGFVLGVGVIGTLDGVVVHELLQWHRFYVDTTQFWRVFIDGLFHLFSAAFLLAGAVMLWRQRRALTGFNGGAFLGAGPLLGMGAFNLYDGVVQHKVLRLHPVRVGAENILLYDLAWNGAALLLLVWGWWLYRRAAKVFG